MTHPVLRSRCPCSRPGVLHRYPITRGRIRPGLFIGLVVLLMVVAGVQAGESYIYAAKWMDGPSPTSITADHNGNIFVADYGAGVFQYRTDGILVRNWNAVGPDENLWYSANGIGVDSQGYVYVLDNLNDPVHVIRKFTAEGTLVKEWQISVNHYWYQGLAVGPDDTIYVMCDTGMELYSPDGTLKKTIPTLNGGAFTLDDQGYLSVVSGGSLKKYTSDGTLLTSWPVAPGQVAVNHAGNVFITGNNEVAEYTPDGSFITRWGEEGSGNGQFFVIAAITTDRDGNVYVAEEGNSRIQKFVLTWTGAISVYLSEYGLPIYLDHEDTGKTTVYNTVVLTDIVPGRHTVSLKSKKPLYPSDEQVVTVYANETAGVGFSSSFPVQVRLDPVSGTYSPGETFRYSVNVRDSYPYNYDYSMAFVTLDPHLKILDFSPCLDYCMLRGQTLDCGGMVYYTPEIDVQVRSDTPGGSLLVSDVSFYIRHDDAYLSGGSNTSTILVKSSSNPVPEFPSALMPVTLAAGLVAVVFLIRRKNS